MITECVEVCPICECENVFVNYDPVANGYKVTCWNCGKEIMLCDECLHADDNPTGKCDWSGQITNRSCRGRCFRGETRR